MVAVAAAAVVAFGDMVIIHAQDARIELPPAITRVDYQFQNLDPIEVTTQFVVPLSPSRYFRPK